MRARCVICGKEFEKTHESAVLCGYPDCFRRYTEDVRHLAMSGARKRRVTNPKTARCVICGKEFEKRGPWANGKTCGKECSAKLGRERGAERQRGYRAANPQKFREYRQKRYAANPEKFLEQNRDSRRRRRTVNPEKFRPIEAKCIICDKQFRKLRNSITCSKECSVKHTRKSRHEYAVTNPGREYRYRQNYYAANAETIREKAREKGREEYANNPERFRERKRNFNGVQRAAFRLGIPLRLYKALKTIHEFNKSQEQSHDQEQDIDRRP